MELIARSQSAKFEYNLLLFNKIKISINIFNYFHTLNNAILTDISEYDSEMLQIKVVAVYIPTIVGFTLFNYSRTFYEQ
ncbi:hypothetical protein CEN50_08630 [Fischerella thermalis CCMEE 5268]|uniref:Uncharacterized protein n=1 Tax=Fischerella thermalis CCMEE 5268 TaxID=2019662 RepID=A0A2N6KI27_9CYAN|nr:hypothetical protein CEN50_08630 [Fischerella thermalis CCMEE 5268]